MQSSAIGASRPRWDQRRIARTGSSINESKPAVDRSRGCQSAPQGTGESKSTKKTTPCWSTSFATCCWAPLGWAFSLDLAALDIQRGRDHGLLNSYNLTRVSYSIPPLDSFADLTSDPLLQAQLASVYGNVDNVDMWVGIISEDHLPGSSMGELGTAILRSQFLRLRDGDRFF